jgi:hypothetical protein
VLVAGRKHFRIYSPADAERMYTVGNLTRVHPNGRINYGDGLTRADGADLQSVKAMEASKRLEGLVGKSKGKQGVASFPQFPDSDDEGDDEQIEAALEAVLAAEMGDEREVSTSYQNNLDPRHTCRWRKHARNSLYILLSGSLYNNLFRFTGGG